MGTPSFRIRLPPRYADPAVLDACLVSAVATLLLIRIALALAGYPQLGGGGLHIAHMLWGGLGMLVALLMLLTFVGPGVRMGAAVIGGAGFGAFIDEIGKFVTADNDYFFRPTAVLVYTIFIVLYLVGRQIRSFRELDADERLVNAIELSEKLATGSLTETERQRALALLRGADHDSSVVIQLEQRFDAARSATRKTAAYVRVSHSALRRYARVVSTDGFDRLIAVIFVLWGISFVRSIPQYIAVLFAEPLGVDVSAPKLADLVAAGPMAQVVNLFAGIVAAGAILVGLWALRVSRTRAYGFFEVAILVDLFLVRPFDLLNVGFLGAAAVLVDLALLATVRYVRAEERALTAQRSRGIKTAEVATASADAATAIRADGTTSGSGGV